MNHLVTLLKNKKLFKMKLLIPISGGKDSQAVLLWAIEKYGVENITSIFCDTGWEHDLTYQHLEYLVKQTGVEYHVLKSKKYTGFLDMVIKRKCFPRAQKRFCTEELKIRPMIDYILSLREHIIIFQGIRSDESNSRSKMNQQCRYFKYYFEPYRSNTLILEKYQENPPKTTAQKAEYTKAIQRLEAGFNDEKFYTYRKKDIIEWCKNYSDEVRRPFFQSTADEVISYSLDRKYLINPLYYFGVSRVGCFPCEYINKSEMKIIISYFPETIDKVRLAEQLVGKTFFAPDYIPEKYHRGFDSQSNKSICWIDDVIQYIKDKNSQLDLLEDLGLKSSCESPYKICE